MQSSVGVCSEICAYADFVCALLSGRDKAEDVTLVDIKHRLQSLIAQLDTHPALAMEQHRMEPESSDMDIHADDSAQRSKVADTHDVDKLYLAGMQRLVLLAQHCSQWYGIALLQNAGHMPVSMAQHHH